MHRLINQSFSLNIIAMKFFFLYPPERYKLLYRIVTYLLYFVLVVPVPVLEIIYLILEENLSFKQFADSVFLLAELICFVLKLYPFLNNSERMKKCIHYFDAPTFQVTREEHQEILDNCIKTCRRTTLLFLTSVTCGFISWSSRPISWKNHTFPTDLWLPFDVETAPKSYICYVYIYVVIAVGYGAYTSAAIDPLIAGLAYQAACQIKILKHNLQFLEEHVKEVLGNDCDSIKRSQMMYAKIRECAVHHNLIMDYVKEYEYCFSQIAFSQFVAGIVVLCVSCLQLTLVDVLSFDFLAMIMYLIAMLSESYLYCHFGTALYDESNSIIQAIYLGQWYEYDLQARKALILIMERAKKPIIVKCGKLVDMSLETFTMILRRSYSLLAVLENYSIDLN